MGLGLLGGKPDRGTTGHLQSRVCRLQVPGVTGEHNQCFQEVQEDMKKKTMYDCWKKCFGEREVKKRRKNEDRCDERPKTKKEEST